MYDEPKSMSLKVLGISNGFRSLWEQHATWTRIVIQALVFNTPDREYSIKRLLRNPKDFAKLLRIFYGDAIANQFNVLLTEHLTLAADLVNALLAGNKEKASQVETAWYQNAENIARFLNSINQFFNFEELKQTMYEHLGLVKTEALQLIEGKYEESINTYDKMEIQILEMADMMTAGILSQFNIY